MASEGLPITLRNRPTANGGEEWFIAVRGQQVGNVGVFTVHGRRPEEMLPVVLRRLLREA